MPKSSPKARWAHIITERVEALRQDLTFRKLEEEGLRLVGRTFKYSAEEWWDNDARKRFDLPGYRGWVQACARLGADYGVAGLMVEGLCLLADFPPKEGLFAAEFMPPRITVLTEVDDPVFLANLAFQAQRLGLTLILEKDGVRTPLLVDRDEKPPPLKVLPPKYTAFTLTVEKPIEYPPEGAAALMKLCARLEKVLLERLGYLVRHRLRPSKLMQEVALYGLGPGKLPRGGAYALGDKIFGVDSSIDDNAKRRTINNRRAKLRKRLPPPPNHT